MYLYLIFIYCIHIHVCVVVCIAFIEQCGGQMCRAYHCPKWEAFTYIFYPFDGSYHTPCHAMSCHASEIFFFRACLTAQYEEEPRKDTVFCVFYIATQIVFFFLFRCFFSLRICCVLRSHVTAMRSCAESVCILWYAHIQRSQREYVVMVI